MMSTGTDPVSCRTDFATNRTPGALFRTAGRGIAAPNASTGNLADARRSPTACPTEDEARGAVRELSVRKPDFIKIWVDDRNGAVIKLSPRLYRAIIDEAHARGIRVMAHVYYLADARDLVEAGVDGFLHLVRDEEMDDALVRRMKEKNVFVTPNLSTSEAGHVYRQTRMAGRSRAGRKRHRRDDPDSRGYLRSPTQRRCCATAGRHDFVYETAAQSGQAECRRRADRARRRSPASRTRSSALANIGNSS
jgi:hypothetical protein